MGNSRQPAPILTWNDRGGRTETVHRGHAVLIGGAGLVESFGDPDFATFPRSSLKPLQLLPLFSDPRFDELGLSDEECAVLFASHSGDERHVAAVRAVQAKVGIPESALRCGSHPPLDREAAQRLYAGGLRESRIHHNCSGKHTGFLVRAKMLGAPLADYLDPEHPVQREVRAVIAELCGVPESSLEPAVDGCGAPAYQLPLSAMGRAFRDLANPERLAPRWRRGAERMFAAANRAPHFVAGRERFDTAMLEARPGRFLCKGGADGFLALGVRAGEGCQGLGFAVKIEDGAARGYETFVPRYMVGLGLLDGTEAPLARFLDGRIENSQKLVVGARRTAVDARRAEAEGWLSATTSRDSRGDAATRTRETSGPPSLSEGAGG